MVFQLVPAEAHRIDVSGVEDVERERLLVKFAHGRELYFAVDLSGGLQYPRLVLDPELGHGRKLYKVLARRFWGEHTFKPWPIRLLSALAGRRDAYAGWTFQQLLENFEVTLETGRPMTTHHFYTTLGLGSVLEVSYSTRTSHPTSVDLWDMGSVLEIDFGFVKKPKSVGALKDKALIGAEKAH